MCSRLFSTWKLFEKLQIFYSLIELSNVSKVPASYIYTRGQQIKIVSRIYGYCQKNRIIFQNVAYLKKYDTEFLGATVIDPIVGYHENVICEDFCSLYPLIIQAYNIDFTSLADDPNEPIQNPNIKDEDCNVMQWSEQALIASMTK